MEIKRGDLKSLWLHKVCSFPQIFYSMHFQRDCFVEKEMSQCYTCLTTLENELRKKSCISGRIFLLHSEEAALLMPSKALGDDAEKVRHPEGQENSPRLTGPGKYN